MIKQRLGQLFTLAGLDINDSITKGEISAYARALEMIKIDIAPNLSALKLMIEPTTQVLNDIFKDEDMLMLGKVITFLSYDKYTIGDKIKHWLFPWQSVNLNGEGRAWSDIDKEARSWQEYKRRKYRWDMLESEEAL